DAVRILSGQPPEVGKNAILESNKRWEAFPDSRFVSYAPETKDLTLLDGWAIEWGYVNGSYVMSPDGEVKQILGTRLLILQKMRDGSWRCFRGMGGPSFTVPGTDRVPHKSAVT